MLLVARICAVCQLNLQFMTRMGLNADARLSSTIITMPMETTRPWLTSSELIAPKLVTVPPVRFVRLPPVTVAALATLRVPLLAQAGVTFNVPGIRLVPSGELFGDQRPLLRGGELVGA